MSEPRDPKAAGISGVKLRTMESAGTVALGSLLILSGLGRRSLFGTLLAGAGVGMVSRAITSRPRSFARLSPAEGVEARRAITIMAPRADLYRLWRRLDNLPRFMEHVKSITAVDELTSRWEVVQGPITLRWMAQIVDDVADKRIAWRSTPDADVENEGSVEFKDAPNRQGTEVLVTMRYRPPGGAMVARPLRELFRRYTAHQLGAELRRLRQLVETGEMSTGASRRQLRDATERKVDRLQGSPERPAPRVAGNGAGVVREGA